MSLNAAQLAAQVFTGVKPTASDTCRADPRDGTVVGGRDRRVCAWCDGPIPARARRDALCCSTRCRQARHRFTTAVGRGVATRSPLRLAYADPPYPGKSRLYVGHPDYAGEVDHVRLIRRLCLEYDGWALSTSAEALPRVLVSCPPGARIAAWVRGERPTRSARPLNAWEPVIYYGGRAVTVEPSSTDRRRLDALVHHARPRLTDPRRVIGAKPAAFCRWLFDLLGAQPGDHLDDLFPGSGGIARAWASYCAGVPVVAAAGATGRASTGDASVVLDVGHDGSPRSSATRRPQQLVDA